MVKLRNNRGTLLIVEPGLRLWGSERALAATLKALTETWDRVVLVLPHGAELAEEVRSHPERYGSVEIFYARIGNLHRRSRVVRLRAMLELAALVLRLRPQRVYLNQAGLVRLLLPIAKSLGIPLVVHVRLIEDVPRVTRLRGSRRWPLDLIFISDAMMAIAGNEIHSDGTTWHNAYDPYPLSIRPERLEKDAPFVSVGRLSHSKGVHLLVEALARPELTKTSADIYGVSVDGDDYGRQLAERAQELDGRIRLKGFSPEVAARLPAYSFLVSTSHYETLGRVVMEAWEAGIVPIVYARSGGAAEMVAKAQGGLVFDEWSAESLAKVLNRAIIMPMDERRYLAAAGRDWMVRELGLQSYRNALLGVLF